jgi:hypothetical protein
MGDPQGSIMAATALTPAAAADMMTERALNPQREPQPPLALQKNGAKARHAALAAIGCR